MQHLVTTNHATGERTVAFFTLDGTPIDTVGSAHLRYDAILAEVDAAAREGRSVNDHTIKQLLRPADVIAERLASFTDQFTSVNGMILYNGIQMNGVIAKQLLAILRDHEASDKDVRGFVRFTERLMMNESTLTREALAAWVADRKLTITHDGHFLAYKGVEKNGAGEFVSCTAGPADIVAVNGVLQPAGKVPNPLGAVVTMDRRFVDDNYNHGCSQGLHVGTYEYARDFGRGVLLLVSVDPAHIVSVPTDCSFHKMRTSEYKVLETTEYEYPHAVYRGHDDDFGSDEDEDSEERCGECDEYLDDCDCCDHDEAPYGASYCPTCGETL